MPPRAPRWKIPRHSRRRHGPALVGRHVLGHDPARSPPGAASAHINHPAVLGFTPAGDWRQRRHLGLQRRAYAPARVRAGMPTTSRSSTRPGDHPDVHLAGHRKGATASYGRFRPPTTCDSGASNSRMPFRRLLPSTDAGRRQSVRPTPPGQNDAQGALMSRRRRPRLQSRALTQGSAARRSYHRNTCPAGVGATARRASNSVTPSLPPVGRSCATGATAHICSRRAAAKAAPRPRRWGNSRRWRNFIYFLQKMRPLL